MGYILRRSLRVALGPEVAGLQRAVALEIADDANDDTRLSWAALDDLALWTAAKDVNVVRNALKRLSAIGWEFRVPLGVGKDGRVIYAVPGRRLTFRVPDFEGVAPATPKGEPPLPIGVAPARSQGAPAPSEGAPATPFSSVPSDSSSISSPLVPGSATAAPADEREIAPEDQILNAYVKALGRPVASSIGNKIRDQAGKLLADGLPAWWIADRAKELAANGWTDLAKHCEMSKIPVETQRPDGLAAPCTTHDPHFRMIRDKDTGDVVECDTCHPAAVARKQREGAA